MAELVYASVLETDGLTALEVRVLSSAPLDCSLMVKHSAVNGADIGSNPIGPARV